jgi:hypothetical protein
VNTQQNPQYCGSCAIACTGSQTCIAGQCVGRGQNDGGTVPDAGGQVPDARPSDLPGPPADGQAP